MERTTRESDRQGPGLLRGWFSANNSQQHTDKQSGKSSQQGNSPRRLSFWVRLLLLMFLINLFFYGPLFFNYLSGQSTTIDLSYSRFLQQVEQGNVTSVTIKSDNSVTGTFKTPVRQQQTASANGSVAATHFTTFIPATGDPGLLPLLEKKGVEINAQPVQPPWWQTVLVLLLNALPVLLLLYFGVMSWRGLRQMQDMQGGGLFSIGRSRAKLYREERPTTTFADVAGVDEAKTELREVIDFLRDPQRFLAIGAHIPKGVLLVHRLHKGVQVVARALRASQPWVSSTKSSVCEV